MVHIKQTSSIVSIALVVCWSKSLCVPAEMVWTDISDSPRHSSRLCTECAARLSLLSYVHILLFSPKVKVFCTQIDKLMVWAGLWRKSQSFTFTGSTWSVSDLVCSKGISTSCFVLPIESCLSRAQFTLGQNIPSDIAAPITTSLVENSHQLDWVNKSWDSIRTSCLFFFRKTVYNF